MTQYYYNVEDIFNLTFLIPNSDVNHIFIIF